jgi:hypothetical protein
MQGSQAPDCVLQYWSAGHVVHPCVPEMKVVVPPVELELAPPPEPDVLPLATNAGEQAALAKSMAAPRQAQSWPIGPPGGFIAPPSGQKAGIAARVLPRPASAQPV